MKQKRSKRYHIEVSGELACFTGPSKVERDSYPVITPSAGRGVLDSIMWKPAIRWEIHNIYVLNPIRYTTFQRIELAELKQFSEKRDLRMTRALRDVKYVLEASFYMTDLAGERDNLKKFVEIFERRMEKGQTYRDPFLGCREFPAYVRMFEGDPKAAALFDAHMPIGTMVLDFKSRDVNEFNMFNAELIHGVMAVDPIEIQEAQC